jgi:uncharacterized integral membrane protein
MQVSVIIGLVFGFIIAFFAVLNTEAVTLNYYFGQVNASVALLVLASATMGALAVGLLGLVSQIRTGFALWGYRNKLQRLTKEVDGLKEQKRALYDDLSFLNAECEQAVRKKEMELEDNRDRAEGQPVAEYVEQSEEKQNDEF